MNANAAARPGAVFNNEGLAQPFLQMLRQKPAHQINRPAGAEGDDNSYRPIRPRGLGMGALDEGQGKGNRSGKPDSSAKADDFDPFD